MTATLFCHGADRRSLFISIKGKSGKACRKKERKKEPFIKKHLSHLGWFTWFDEGKNVDVTGMVKKIEKNPFKGNFSDQAGGIRKEKYC